MELSRALRQTSVGQGPDSWGSGAVSGCFPWVRDKGAAMNGLPDSRGESLYPVVPRSSNSSSLPRAEWVPLPQPAEELGGH